MYIYIYIYIIFHENQKERPVSGNSISLQDCPSAFLKNTTALLLKRRALFGEKFDPIFPF